MKKLEWSASYDFTQRSELSEVDQRLIDEATKSREHAYAPYSRYKVGASALLSDGSIVVGSNQENAAYPSGLCAERVVLFACGAQYPNENIETVAIITQAHGDLPASSCGSCRQVLSEFEQRQTNPIRILFCDTDGNVLISSSVRDLMPFSFEGDRLG